MKVALAQIEPEPGGVSANVALHLEHIEQAVSENADLIVFPELSLTGDKTGPYDPGTALTLNAEAVAEIGEASQKIDVVVGLTERGETNLYDRYNSAFYFSNGALVHRHRKLFLVTYGVFDEGKHFVPGYNLQAFDSHLGRICMLVCNDIWHLSIPYLAALDGAEMILVLANSARDTLGEYLTIPTTWEHINRAVSATAGCYTIYVNRVGKRRDTHGTFPYWGGSEIIGPRGEVIVKAPYDQEALVYGEVTPARVGDQRFSAPILRDARLWILRQELDRLAKKRSGAVTLDGSSVKLDSEQSGGRGNREHPRRD
jgi:predicted amidohydrolase